MRLIALGWGEEELGLADAKVDAQSVAQRDGDDDARVRLER
jgi:hypothetical protein